MGKLKVMNWKIQYSWARLKLWLKMSISQINFNRLYLPIMFLHLTCHQNPRNFLSPHPRTRIPSSTRSKKKTHKKDNEAGYQHFRLANSLISSHNLLLSINRISKELIDKTISVFINYFSFCKTNLKPTLPTMPKK